MSIEFVFGKERKGITPIESEFTPVELRKRDQWIIWQQERDTKGKPTKVPYRAGFRTKLNKASTTNPEHWESYLSSIVTYKNHHGDGIGFVFAEEDPYTGIDFDNTPDQDEWIKRFDSYTEWSPSGKGVHIIIHGKMPEGKGRKRGDYEAYSEKRFFTFTGKHVEGTPTEINERQDVLDQFIAEKFPKRSQKKQPKPTCAPAHKSTLADDELIEKIRDSRQGPLFNRLWSRDTSGYPSRSEADLALCNILAFWTGNDPVAIDRIFRQSKLYREKWERSDYRDETIRLAIDGRTETYQPHDGASVILANGADLEVIEDEIEDDVEPPPLPDLLEDVADFIARYVVLTDHQRDTIAIWIAHTHAFDAADQTPYISLTSAEKRSGKTRLLECLELLVARPWLTGRTTAAALVRKVDKDRPTLLLDESDAAFKGDKEYAESLRGILNTGHRRGGVASLCIGQGANIDVRDFSTFSPKVIAGIGKLPDTVTDRSIPIELKRKAPNEDVERFRWRTASAEAKLIADGLRAWASSETDNLTGAEPDLPDELDDRAQDGWEPLLAIAEATGEDWLERARAAALALSADAEHDDDSLGVKLLKDIKVAFDKAQEDRILTSSLLSRLNSDDESPWGGFRDGDGMNGRNLANILKRYDIQSITVRTKEGRARGYKREDFEDAWSRYLPSDPPAKCDIRDIPINMGKTEGSASVTQTAMSRIENADFPDSHADVTDKEGGQAGTGRCSVCGNPTDPITGLCLSDDYDDYDRHAKPF